MTTSALHAALRAAEPQRVALDDGSRIVTFGELGPLLDHEGDWLAGGGERFALLADNGVGWALTDLALHLRQLPSVPLPGYFTEQQIQHALDECGIDCVLADETMHVGELLAGWRNGGISGRTGLTMFRRQLDAAARRGFLQAQ